MPTPDLILLDISMPGASGYEVCERIKRDPRLSAIPVIFLSSHGEAQDVTRGLELGAVDFLAKPVPPSVLLARVRNHLRLHESSVHLADENHHLDHLVSETTQALHDQIDEVIRVQDLIIVALGTVAETRDSETGNHIFRTRAYVKALVESLSATHYYQRNRSDYDWSQIWKSAPLHDIGKVGIPDAILLKPGRLDREEFEIMKRHTELGRRALSTAESRVNAQRSYLRVAIDIAYGHHERWDGSGYPEGLAGNAIPVSARLMAVADVYDALISKRVYKPALPHADAVEIIRGERGAHFDPDVVDCFIDLNGAFDDIALEFSDTDEPDQPSKRR